MTIHRIFAAVYPLTFRHLLLGLALLCLVLASLVAVAAEETYETGRLAYQQDDFVEAERIWRQLAEQGEARSQFFLGVLYDEGREPVGKDDAKAFHWFEKAAGQGHVNAQFNLGNAYINGRGTAKDPERAVYWWQKAADAGFPSAQFNLAIQYYQGGGVDKDWDKAVFYFNQAASNGHGKSQKLLDSGRVPRLENTAQSDSDRAVQEQSSQKEPTGDAVPSGAGWLATQNPGYYTIQLVVAGSEDGLDRLIARHKLLNEAVKVPIHRDGKTLYYLLMGSFAERREANLRIESLAPELRASKPWARPFAELQPLVKGS